jgi:hypothetical protein
MIEPAAGTNTQLIKFPRIAVEDPAGVNVEAVGDGIVQPESAIGPKLLPPIVPVTGVVGGVPGLIDVAVELDELAGCEKLVGMAIGFVIPVTTSDPDAPPVVELVGMTWPAFGTKLQFWIVPIIAVVVPLGVKVAIVGFGIVQPESVIVERFVPPIVPVTGVVGGVPGLIDVAVELDELAGCEKLVGMAIGLVIPVTTSDPDAPPVVELVGMT